MTSANTLLDIIAQNRAGVATGLPDWCTAHPETAAANLASISATLMSTSSIPKKTAQLSFLGPTMNGPLFEAYSTDYPTPQALGALVAAHFPF